MPLAGVTVIQGTVGAAVKLSPASSAAMLNVYGTSAGSFSVAAPPLPVRGRTLSTATGENDPAPGTTQFVSTAYTRTKRAAGTLVSLTKVNGSCRSATVEEVV